MTSGNKILIMYTAKLYCPDFRSVFGNKFANPFWFPNIDSQLWPVLSDIELPKDTKNLLNLERGGHSRFYRRKITLNQMLLELESGSFGSALVQALVLGEKYGIPNKLALEVAKLSERLSPVISVIPSKSGLGEVKILRETFEKHGGLAGVVIYPAYQGVSLVENPDVEDFCKELGDLGLPMKIDISDLRLPNQDMEMIERGKIGNFIRQEAQRNENLNLILAGISSVSDISFYAEAFKWCPNVYLELNHRTLGGISPSGFLKEVLAIPGFVNNYWSRILFGSGTPTLEPSQMMRAFLEATSDPEMSFAYKNLLLSWGFRNGWRIYGHNAPESRESSALNDAIEQDFTLKTEHKVNDNTVRLGYDMQLQSFSITQLVSFQSLFEQLMAEVKEHYPKMCSGHITVKSYHTTTSIIVNEHEIGNYLQLHYLFAEKTLDNPDDKLHTVAAAENRADFNFPDHITASSYGQRSITYPIRDGEVAKGGRENMYALVTFGPRKVNISVDITLSESA